MTKCGSNKPERRHTGQMCRKHPFQSGPTMSSCAHNHYGSNVRFACPSPNQNSRANSFSGSECRQEKARRNYQGWCSQTTGKGARLLKSPGFPQLPDAGSCSLSKVITYTVLFWSLGKRLSRLIFLCYFNLHTYVTV